MAPGKNWRHVVKSFCHIHGNMQCCVVIIEVSFTSSCEVCCRLDYVYWIYNNFVCYFQTPRLVMSPQEAHLIKSHNINNNAPSKSSGLHWQILNSIISKWLIFFFFSLFLVDLGLIHISTEFVHVGGSSFGGCSFGHVIMHIVPANNIPKFFDFSGLFKPPKMLFTSEVVEY